MAAFLRPGERKAGAFGISFDSDRDAGATVQPYNHNEKLGLQDQRRRLPVYQHRHVALQCPGTAACMAGHLADVCMHLTGGRYYIWWSITPLPS